VSGQNQNFSLSGRLKSMRHALDGIRALLHEKHTTRIHALAAVTVLAAIGAAAAGLNVFLPHATSQL